MFLLQNIKFSKLFTSKNSPTITPATLSSFSAKRLCKEFQVKDDILKAHVSTWLPSPENVFRWEATIIGPTNSPFANGVFTVSIHIPTEYPFEPPKIKFKTKIFHPNINKKGEIDVDILGLTWSTVLTINSVLLSICSVLSDPVEPFRSGNPAVKLYLKNRRTYEKIAREWTLKYAIKDDSLTKKKG